MNDMNQILSIIEGQSYGKLQNKWYKTLMKAIIAGMFIGIGGTACIRVMNKFNPSDGLGTIMGTFVFTIGFVLIISLGVELFTSNNFMTFNLFSGKAKLNDIIKNWSLVWFGNFIGVIFIAVLMVYSNAYNEIELDYISHLVEKKTHLTFSSAVLLGIGCNMIIVLTVMLVNASNDYFAKVFVAIFGIMVFLLCGFEHVVANMYYVSLGVLLDGSSIIDVLSHNILPVTIGNIIGGGIIIPVLFYYTYKK